MPLLYETYAQAETLRHPSHLSRSRSLQVTRKSYRVEFPSTIHEGTTLGRGKITWNPEKTTVINAYLRTVGDLVVGGASFITPVKGRVSFIVNAMVDGEHLGPLCIGECHSSFTLNHLITYMIQNGENEVKVEVAKSWGWPTWVEVRNFSCHIIVDFEGEDPIVDIKPPPPPWEKYLKWGLLGVGAIVITGAVIKTVPALMKKK